MLKWLARNINQPSVITFSTCSILVFCHSLSASIIWLGSMFKFQILYTKMQQGDNAGLENKVSFKTVLVGPCKTLVDGGGQDMWETLRCFSELC